MSTTSTRIAVSITVFHKGAERHVDDAACLWIIRTRPEAELYFPGISTAEIIFDGTGGERYEGKSGDELEDEEILMFGVGGGRFDEHPGPANPGGRKECSFSLFCKHIGIADDPALAKIIQYVAESDRGNAGHYFALGSLAKIMPRLWPNDPMRVFQWQIEAFSAIYEEQKEFCQTADEFKERAVKELFEAPSGRMILMVSVVSDRETMSNYARSQGAKIVIQQRPIDCETLPGSVMVFTDSRAMIGLAGVVENLRLEEQRARRRPVPTDRQKLRSPGKAKGMPEWYYLTGGNGEMILNGSTSAPQTPATCLPLSVVADIVKANLESR